ncbi:MAG: hypothetical protein H5T61_09785 [Thermoflexales bacterium]|nr:hypothetical protein [Thermoflexales bacterium]
MALERIVTTGIIQGNTIVLDQKVPLPEGSPVILTVTPRESDRELMFYAQLETEGLVSLPRPVPEEIYPPEPLVVSGKPLSQIIVEERR